MADFEPWDIVRVPFPYTDRPVRQRRPALVIAAGELQTAHGLLWLAMITSEVHRGWPGDVVVSDLRTAGLPAPSIEDHAVLRVSDCGSRPALRRAATAEPSLFVERRPRGDYAVRRPHSRRASAVLPTQEAAVCSVICRSLGFADSLLLIAWAAIIRS